MKQFYGPRRYVHLPFVPLLSYTVPVQLPLAPTDIGILLATLAMIVIAGMSLCVRLGTTDGTASNALLTVQFVNVIVFVTGTLILYNPIAAFTPLSFIAFACAGVAGTLLGRGLTYLSIERIGASRTEPVKSSQPLHATLIAVVILNEVVGVVHLVGIVLIVVGVGLVSWESTHTEDDRIGDIGAAELGLPLLGAFFYGLEPTLAKVGFADGTPVLAGLAVKTIVAFVGFCAFLGYRGKLSTAFSVRQPGFRWFVAAGLLNTTFLAVYYLALEVAPVSVVLPIITASPLAVVVLSRLFLPKLERVTWRLGVATTVVVCGALIIALFG